MIKKFVLIIRTVSLFLKIGKGAPARWDVSKKIVVLRPYRYMRNPKITGYF
jgi:hypothetical protein